MPPEIGGARCPVGGCWPSCLKVATTHTVWEVTSTKLLYREVEQWIDQHFSANALSHLGTSCQMKFFLFKNSQFHMQYKRNTEDKRVQYEIWQTPRQCTDRCLKLSMPHPLVCSKTGWIDVTSGAIERHWSTKPDFIRYQVSSFREIMLRNCGLDCLHFPSLLSMSLQIWRWTWLASSWTSYVIQTSTWR